MKKLATKVALKSAIKALINETASKVVKLARSNGFEIVTYHHWNDIRDLDLQDFQTGEQIIRDTSPFAEEDLDSLNNIVADVDTGRLEVATHADIVRFVKNFNDKKVAYDKEQKAMKSANAPKIAQLKKRIAKAQAELDRLTA